MQVLESAGSYWAAGHLVGGLWMLGNILFNYYLCVTTYPGYTTDVSVEVGLYSYML